MHHIQVVVQEIKLLIWKFKEYVFLLPLLHLIYSGAFVCTSKLEAKI